MTAGYHPEMGKIVLSLPLVLKRACAFVIIDLLTLSGVGDKVGLAAHPKRSTRFRRMR
jgi:hypothetical protein